MSCENLDFTFEIGSSAIFPNSNQSEDEIFCLQSYLSSITSRMTPPFFERKMQKGVANSIEEEIEELYSEMFELDAYIKSLLNTNALLLNNYEEKSRETDEKKLRLSEKYQILKEDLQQVKKDLNEMAVMKDKLSNRNESLSEQIKKMEQMYNKTSKKYDNLNEEILTMSDYEDKVYQLKEEMSLNSDLINNLKYEYNEYKLLTNLIKQKNLKKDKKKILLKSKLIKYEEKLKNLMDKEKNEINIHEHMVHHLEFLTKTFKNLNDIHRRKEEEKKHLNNMIEQSLSIKKQYNHKMLSEENENYYERKLEDIKSPLTHKTDHNLDNLEQEFKEMNLQGDVFLSMNDQFGLFSQRNPRILTNNWNQLTIPVSPRLTRNEKEKTKENELREKKLIKMNKKKKEKPDKVYRETIKFVMEHKYKFFLVFILIPIFRYNYNSK